MPLVARARAVATERIGVGLAKLPAPLAHRLVGQDDTALREQLLHVTVTEGEPKVEPDRVADDLRREPMAFVVGGGILLIHARSIARRAS